MVAEGEERAASDEGVRIGRSSHGCDLKSSNCLIRKRVLLPLCFLPLLLLMLGVFCSVPCLIFFSFFSFFVLLIFLRPTLGHWQPYIFWDPETATWPEHTGTERGNFQRHHYHDLFS